MKIVYMGIFKNDGDKPVELSNEYYLSGYSRFFHKNIMEVTALFTDQVALKTLPGMRLSIAEKEGKEEGWVAHSYARTEGICGIIVSDKEYPPESAHPIISKICDEFLTKYPRTAYANIPRQEKLGTKPPLTFPELKDYIVKYQDPGEADTIAKIQKDLDATVKVLYQSIDVLLERGEKLSDLVAKSDGLSAQSKMFYTQAKKQNSCCVVM